MTPLVLVVALSAFVHPHSSRDVRPAIVTRRVEPSSTVHPVREFVGRCVDPEVPAPTSELTEAVIIIGLFLLHALFCPCCRMVLAMPGKVASAVASTVLGRLRGGGRPSVRMCAVVGLFCVVCRVVGEDAIARFWNENGFPWVVIQKAWFLAVATAALATKNPTDAMILAACCLL